MLGGDKGTVIFVPVDETDIIYSRVYIHKEAVCHILEVKDSDVFVSVSSSHRLSLWTVTTCCVSIISNVLVHRPVHSLVPFRDNQVLVAF